MRRLKTLLIVFIIALIIVLPKMANAQVVPLDVSIEMIPLNPEPGESVTLTATSFGTDLSQVNIVWNYNGQVVASGIGKNKISVTAPKAGTTGSVSVSVNGNGLSTGSSTIFLRPASVDLLWEAVDSYTPPFYKGKALLPTGGVVRLSAIPSSSAPKNLSYKWSRNGSAIQDASGFGKSSLVIKQDSLNNLEKINLEIHSGAFSGSSSSTLTSINPDLVAYKNNEGFVNYATGFNKNISINNNGVVLHFEPYYFSVPHSIGRDLAFTTSIDGESVNPLKPNEVGLSRPQSIKTSNLKMKILTVAYSLQHLEKNFSLLFN